MLSGVWMDNSSKIGDDMASGTDAGMNYDPRIHARWEKGFAVTPHRLSQGLLLACRVA